MSRGSGGVGGVGGLSIRGPSKAGPGGSDSRCQGKQQSLVRCGEIQRGVAVDHNAGLGMEGQALDDSDI